MKNYMGECSSKVTRQNGERSKILVSNPGLSFPVEIDYSSQINDNWFICTITFHNKKIHSKSGFTSPVKH